MRFTANNLHVYSDTCTVHTCTVYMYSVDGICHEIEFCIGTYIQTLITDTYTICTCVSCIITCTITYLHNNTCTCIIHVHVHVLYMYVYMYMYMYTRSSITKQGIMHHKNVNRIFHNNWAATCTLRETTRALQTKNSFTLIGTYRHYKEELNEATMKERLKV